ncbi:hypothetical protein [Escherichia coli]|nr:hypothetical protein [Escherichia coli]MCK2574127.1 hypothetical protein [Escherichia coli]MED8479861.1 hypothetical protein [Escherichia coli]MED8494061.1 hypothetical protein [Escherichia coli]MED8498178.1 hypothetical protein [Escherichia coli]WBZ83972.1 hypothetical protein PIC86_09535 [Escherichia coli]
MSTFRIHLDGNKKA